MMKSPEQNALSKTETVEAPFKQTLYKTGFESTPVQSTHASWSARLPQHTAVR